MPLCQSTHDPACKRNCLKSHGASSQTGNNIFQWMSLKASASWPQGAATGCKTTGFPRCDTKRTRAASTVSSEIWNSAAQFAPIRWSSAGLWDPNELWSAECIRIIRTFPVISGSFYQVTSHYARSGAGMVLNGRRVILRAPKPEAESAKVKVESVQLQDFSNLSQIHIYYMYLHCYIGVEFYVYMECLAMD